MREEQGRAPLGTVRQLENSLFSSFEWVYVLDRVEIHSKSHLYRGDGRMTFHDMDLYRM